MTGKHTTRLIKAEISDSDWYKFKARANIVRKSSQWVIGALLKRWTESQENKEKNGP